jgi:hypothetical protein
LEIIFGLPSSVFRLLSSNFDPQIRITSYLKCRASKFIFHSCRHVKFLKRRADDDFYIIKKQFMKKILFALSVSFTWTLAFSQNVGVGTTTPVEKLDVAGNIKTTGEIKPNGTAGQAGQVLTSNGNGTMQWAQSAVSGGGNINGNGGWGDCSIYNIDSLRLGANINPMVGDGFGRTVAISGNYAIVGSTADDENGFTNCGSATILKFNSATGQWDSQIKLTNANPANDELFGYAVAISGDYAIVGVFSDDDGPITNSGSVTIYKRNSATDVWESQGKIVNPTPAISDNFGAAVAISGDYAMVGSTGDDEAGLTDNGSVTILKRNTTTGIWENQGKLICSTPVNLAAFGYALSLSGDYLIVGAPFDNEAASQAGSVSFFKRNAIGVWESQGKFFKPGTVIGDRLGTSVSIWGDYAIAGVPQDDDMGAQAGAAIIYKRNTGTGLWEVQDKIYNPDPAADEYFGMVVGISDEYAIGASYRDDENGITDVGTATIYKRIQTIWHTHQKFSYPGYHTANSQFGYGVGITNNHRFIVSAPQLYSKGMVFFGTVK